MCTRTHVHTRAHTHTHQGKCKTKNEKCKQWLTIKTLLLKTDTGFLVMDGHNGFFSSVVFVVLWIFPLDTIFRNMKQFFKKKKNLREHYLHANLRRVRKFQREGWELLTKKRQTGKKTGNRANLPKALSSRNIFLSQNVRGYTQNTNISEKIRRKIRSGSTRCTINILHIHISINLIRKDKKPWETPWQSTSLFLLDYAQFSNEPI